MKTACFATLALAALVAAASPARAGIPAPGIDMMLGGTFATNGSPGGGGFSAAIAPLWRVTDHARFGLSLSADDIGSSLVPLYDRNDGQPLGTVETMHRMTWGLAWRCDVDAFSRGLWDVDGVSTLGACRIQDDHLGQVTRAASAVGWTVGANAMRDLGHGRELGLALRFNRIFPERDAAYDRVGRYFTAALEWRWNSAAER